MGRRRGSYDLAPPHVFPGQTKTLTIPLRCVTVTDMSESIRVDGLPVLTDCAQCGAATFRPVPDDPNHLCSDCDLGTGDDEGDDAEEWPKPKEHPMQAELRGAMPYELTWSDDRGEQRQPFADYEDARKHATMYAAANKGRSYYLGARDCHPMDRTRYCWDRSQGRVIPFACND